MLNFIKKVFSFVKTTVLDVLFLTIRGVLKTVIKALYHFNEAFWDAFKVIITLGIIALIAFPAIRFISQNLDKLPMPHKQIKKEKDLAPFITSDALENIDISKNSALIRLHMPNDQFFCSGFVISNIYAITAAHCVDDSLIPNFDRKNIKIFNDQIKDTGVSATTIFSSNGQDLAILRGDFKNFNKLLIVLSPMELFNSPGNDFLTCGFPYGDRKLCIPFKLMGSHEFMLGGQSFLYPGMSGGPTVNMTTGKVIAVNHGVQGSISAVAPIIGLFNNANIEIK